MSSKQTVLALLERNKGDHISGEAIARQLEITRAAVWKSIAELRADGHVIEASTRIGYRLAQGSDILTKEGLSSALASLSLEHLPLYYHPMIGSTNREAKRLALEGAAHGTVVVAGTQSEGRGRNGRSFHSPRGSGIYLSMILRPDVSTSVALRITSAAAVAVARGIAESCHLEVGIKWVNDLLLEGKKVCGILTEGVSGFESGRIESIVVGIGINHSVPEGGFPADIAQIAGALFAREFPPCATRAHVAGTIIAHLLKVTDRLDDPSVMAEYRHRSVVIGQHVLVIQGSSQEQALATGIADDGALIVRMANGEERHLRSGEISLRPVGNSAWGMAGKKDEGLT